jgi:hypothetical protein
LQELLYCLNAFEDSIATILNGGSFGLNM